MAHEFNHKSAPSPNTSQLQCILDVNVNNIVVILNMETTMHDKTTDPLVIEILFFLSKFEERFLELAALLRKLQEKSPNDFKTVYAIPQLGRRKAYYLVSIDKAFGACPQLRDRLMKVGWTRLALVAPFVTPENREDALLFAELNTAWAIQQALKGKELPIGVRSVLLHFSPEQFAYFAQEIVKHGATKNGDGFADKETALIKALAKAASWPIGKSL